MDKTIAMKEVPCNNIDSKTKGLQYIFTLCLEIYWSLTYLEC